MYVEFDEWLGEDWYSAELAQRATLKVLQDEIDFVIFHNGIFVAYYVLMVETFEYVDFLFDGLYELLADGYLLHGYEAAIVEVDALVDFAICSLADLLDKLVALDRLVLNYIIHH